MTYISPELDKYLQGEREYAQGCIDAYTTSPEEHSWDIPLSYTYANLWDKWPQARDKPLTEQVAPLIDFYSELIQTIDACYQSANALASLEFFSS